MKKSNVDGILQRTANSVARKLGCWRADEFIFGEENKIVKRIHCGYRKKSNGQYVPNAYLKNFGWKNTYYQHSFTKVMISKLDYKEEYQAFLLKQII
jgi:hypothetical protein